MPFTPGGGVDINARLLAPKLTEYLGQQVIVDNRPGAGTNIGNEFVAKSAPDGYTLLINGGAMAINMALYKKLNYDTLRDFVAISLFSESPNVLVVHPSLPVKTAKELVALAKAKPGALNFSSSGSGTTQHLSGELFNLRTGMKMVHVPFKGTAPSLTAVRRRRSRAHLREHSRDLRVRQSRAAASARDDGPEARGADAGRADAEGRRHRRGGDGAIRDLRADRDAQGHRQYARGRDRQGGTLAGYAPAPARPGRGAGRQLAGGVRKIMKEEVVRWAEVVRVSGAKAD